MFWFRKSKPTRQGDVKGIVNLTSGYNVRELGGYDTPYGRTHNHRYLRSGGILGLSRQDAEYLRTSYGVRRVLDLRGELEVGGGDGILPTLTGVEYKNVQLYDFDLSDPKLDRPDNAGGYLASNYFTMLANRDAICEIFDYFATAPADCCVLFHCAAGMDRTGVTTMLLLGLCDVARDVVIADYAYSFGSLGEVNAAIFAGAGDARHKVRQDLADRIAAISTVYDRLIDTYGSVRNYLTDAGVSKAQLEAARRHLLG